MCSRPPLEMKVFWRSGLATDVISAESEFRSVGPSLKEAEVSSSFFLVSFHVRAYRFRSQAKLCFFYHPRVPVSPSAVAFASALRFAS